MEITYQEAQLIAAALRAFENEARSDEPHGAHAPEFRQFQRRINIVARGREFIILNTDQGLPIGETIHRDGKAFRVTDNTKSVTTTAILV